MSPGDIFITIFVAGIFFGGIFFGIRLFKWNMKDQKEKAERNAKIREKNKSK